MQKKEDRRRAVEGEAGGREQKEQQVAAYREAFGVKSTGCATGTVVVSDWPKLSCSKPQPLTVPDVLYGAGGLQKKEARRRCRSSQISFVLC